MEVGQTQAQPPAPVQPIQIQFALTDVIAGFSVLISSASVVLWRRAIKALHSMQDKAPERLLPRERNQAQLLLAQLALLYGADRASLGLFHNGTLDATGFHLQRLTISASYVKPGIAPLPEFGRAVPLVGVPELAELWQCPDGVQTLGIEGDHPPGCREYLRKRSITCLQNRLLMAGQVAVAVVSMHWCNQGCSSIANAPLTPQAKQLFDELQAICAGVSMHPLAN